MRAIQGHREGNKVDLSLLEYVEIPCNWSEYIYQVGSSLDLHSVIQSGLITAVFPVTGSQEDEHYDVMRPRKVPH